MKNDLAPCVRIEWLYEAARASQEVLCDARAHSLTPNQVVNALRRLPEAASPVERLVLQGLLLDVLLGCLEGLGESQAERTLRVIGRLLESVARPAPLLDTPAYRAAEIIRQHSAAPLRADHLAKTVGCDPSRLRRGFKRELGITMREFHTKARIAEAIPMFAGGDTKTVAIARSVGYRSDKDFYRALRDVTGQRPRDLRLLPRQALDEMAQRLFPPGDKSH